MNILKLLKIIIKYILLLLIILTLNTQLFSQSAKLISDEPNAVNEPNSGLNNFINVYKMRIGMLPGACMPMGDVSNVLGMGYGGNLLIDGMLVSILNNNIYLRAGMNAGFYYLPTEIDTTLMMVPITISGKIIYQFSFGLSPYIGLDGGATINYTSGEVAKSSTTGTAAFNIGMSFQHSILPKGLEIFLGAEYLMVFESVTGQFLNAMVGVSYGFGDAAVIIKKSSKDRYTTQESVLMY